jgi:tetratricopeptide (TPR) repeat protein
MRAVFVAFILVCVPANAFAQFTNNPLSDPAATSPRAMPERSINAGSDEPAEDWARCSNHARRFAHEEVLLGCDALLNTELSREYRASALYWRAMAYRQADDEASASAAFDAALQAYADWVAEEPHSVNAHYEFAGFLVYLQRYDAALAEYTLVDELLPRQPYTHGGLGRLAFARGDYLTAIREYDRAQALADRRANGGNYDAGRCEARAAARVELDLARSLCNRAVRLSLRLSQGSSHTLVSRGFLNFILGDLEAARADFAGALEQNEHLGSARYGHGVVLVHLGRIDEGSAEIAVARTLASERTRLLEAAGLR